MKATAKLFKKPKKIIGDGNVTMVTCPEFDDPVLFAVTQDIKVGDDVINTDYIEMDGMKTHKVTQIDGIMIFTDAFPDNDSIWQHKEITFKVLGEISPDADFVKDGDEIEIDMVHKWKGSKWHRSEMIAMVKCSQCNTYH